ncbi:MAG: hypothetical protein Q4C10_01545 [Clostridia bacterium]|nr:hypothetical protein [Clostridia bacterium]
MRRFKGTLTALLVAAVCLMAAAAAAVADEDMAGRFIGSWDNDDFIVEFSCDEERDFIVCRMARDDGDTIAMWEYDSCWYDEEKSALFCVNCTRWREGYDPETLETVETDWSLDDMEWALFSLSEDGERLFGADIAGLDGTLELSRCEDLDFFDD